MRRNQSDIEKVRKLDILSTRQGMGVRHDDHGSRLQERFNFNRRVVDGQYADSDIELLLRNPRLDVEANPRCHLGGQIRRFLLHQYQSR